MIPALIIWLFKRFLAPALNIDPQKISLKGILAPAKKISPLVVALILSSSRLCAQEQTIKYNILHGDNVVGHLDLYQKKTAGDVYFKMTSAVRMRFIFRINIDINEESLFRDGKLINSQVNRKVNGKEKVNRQTIAKDSNYQTLTEGKPGTINQKQISCNLMMLYCHEPCQSMQVYSDNFQQFLTVKKTDDHRYRIDLPDGNYNYYTYTNGICSSVEIHHSLYTIQIRLT